jgi:hypothetical protein
MSGAIFGRGRCRRVGASHSTRCTQASQGTDRRIRVSAGIRPWFAILLAVKRCVPPCIIVGHTRHTGHAFAGARYAEYGPGMRYSAGGAAKPQTKTPMPNRRHLVPRPAHRSPAELGYHRHRHTGERPLEAKLSAIAFRLCLASPVAPYRSENPKPKLDAAKPPSTIVCPPSRPRPVQRDREGWHAPRGQDPVKLVRLSSGDSGCPR